MEARGAVVALWRSLRLSLDAFGESLPSVRENKQELRDRSTWSRCEKEAEESICGMGATRMGLRQQLVSHS